MTSISPSMVVQGDRESIMATLTDPDGYQYDLTNRTVEFVMWSGRHGTVIDRAATVTDATVGEVEVELTPPDTDLADYFRVEFRITGANDDPTTAPREEPLRLTIRPNGSGI